MLIPIKQLSVRSFQDRQRDKRITYLDTAKGMAILLMVFSHSGIGPATINQIIFSFHMPLFFLITGFQITQEKVQDYPIKAEIMKGIRQYLVPMFLMAILIGGLRTHLIWLYCLYGSNQALSKVNTSSALWFLPCYFLSVIVFKSLMKFTWKLRHSEVVAAAFMMLCSAVACALDYKNSPAIGFPFSVNIVFSAITFIYVGYLCKMVLIQIQDYVSYWLIAIAMASLILLGILTYGLNREALDNPTYHYVVMAVGLYGNYFLFFTTAVVFSLGVICACILIDNVALNYLGRNTLVILGFHVVTLSWGRRLLDHFNGNWAGSLYYYIALTCISVGLCIVIAPLINTFTPNVLGKK